MADLKVINDAKGQTVYRDHLPLLGQPDNSDNASHCFDFQINDRVRIELDPEILQSLQHGHGGWTDGMRECIGSIGNGFFYKLQ